MAMLYLASHSFIYMETFVLIYKYCKYYSFYTFKELYILSRLLDWFTLRYNNKNQNFQNMLSVSS